jgi:thiamine-phosphate pyrophosphorylase
MDDHAAPKIYLVTPPDFEPAHFANQLAAVLDQCEVACVRLQMATRDEARLIGAAEACRDVTSPRDVALVISEHVQLAERLGLDGVHLSGPRGVRAARKVLGSDAIVGASCGASRHDGMSAGEAGADYVAFGPVGGPPLGSEDLAPPELFQWWSEMIEIPVVAELGMTEEAVAELWSCTDFLAFGEELWSMERPAERLASLMRV